MASIVQISESLLGRAGATDGRILRDRVLSGFGVRLNARKRTFLIATRVGGKQFRMMLGHWPLMSVDEARSLTAQTVPTDPAIAEPSLAISGTWLPLGCNPNYCFSSKEYQ